SIARAPGEALPWWAQNPRSGPRCAPRRPAREPRRSIRPVRDSLRPGSFRGPSLPAVAAMRTVRIVEAGFGNQQIAQNFSPQDRLGDDSRDVLSGDVAVP